MIQVVTLTTDPVDLFAAAGLGTGGFGTARTPGFVFKAENIGQETVRYASAPDEANRPKRWFPAGCRK